MEWMPHMLEMLIKDKIAVVAYFFPELYIIDLLQYQSKRLLI